MCVCLYHRPHQEPLEAQKRHLISPGTGVTNDCRLRCGCWERNLGPLTEHRSCLTTEPFLQPQINMLKKIFFFEADSHVATIGLKLSVQPRVTLNFPASSLSLPSSVISLYGAGNGTPHARNPLPIKELCPRFFYFFEVRVMCWDHLSILFWDV